MNNKIVLKSGIGYTLKDFQISNLLKNNQLLNELDMKTLPETFLNIFGVTCEDRYKDILKKKINLYDKSQNVNSFIYKGKMYWLDKQQRSCIKTITESNLENIDNLKELALNNHINYDFQLFEHNLQEYEIENLIDL